MQTSNPTKKIVFLSGDANPIKLKHPGQRFWVHEDKQADNTHRITTTLLCRYPGGFAWPARDNRFGRYITCPVEAEAPFGLAVHDDHGDLVPVPCSGGMATVYPTTGMLS